VYLACIAAIWCRAVDATHHFLTLEDREAIEATVRDFLPKTLLWVAVDANDYPLASMLLDDGHMEALFGDGLTRSFT
jgi:putative acetyltransferase